MTFDDSIFAQSDPEQFPVLPEIQNDAIRLNLAERGRNDTFFLATGILGYEDLTPHTHGALCRFLDRALYQRRMILMPRTHFKTTIAIVAHSIRLILNDPNIRILIVSDTDENAKLMLGEISNHFKYNEMFRWLYGELIPRNFNKARWNANEITVERSKRHLKEATITSSGTFGAIESKHFDYIKADDLVTEKHIHSDSEMDKLAKWVGGLEPLLDHDRCTIDFIGSRKKKGDPYEHMMKFYSGNGGRVAIGPHAELRGELALFSRAIVEDGERIFPERVSWAYINRMKKFDPERYSAQLANDPKASGLNIFREDDLRFFTLSRSGLIEAWEAGELVERASIWDMDRIILFDPSVAEKKSSSQNAIIVVAKGSGPRRYVLRTRIGHFPLDEAVSLLFDWDKEFKPFIVSVEKRGFQGSVKYWLAERAQLRRVPELPVVEWPPEGSPKANWAKKEHIRGLQPLTRENLIWLQEDQTELVEQFEFYPNVRWDDGLDCLAQGLDYWPYTEDEEWRAERERAEMEHLANSLGARGRRTILVAESDRRAWSEEDFLRSFSAGGYSVRGRMN